MGYDKLRSHAMTNRDFNCYLGTPDLKAQMPGEGYNPNYRPMTRYSVIGRPWLSLAEEILLFRPRKELQHLFDLIANVLATHLVR